MDTVHKKILTARILAPYQHAISCCEAKEILTYRLKINFIDHMLHCALYMIDMCKLSLVELISPVNGKVRAHYMFC